MEALIILVWAGILVFSCLGTVLWVFALVDCVKREFPGENDKLLWILVIVLGHALGALVYWFVGRDRGTMPYA